jgi:hypothetical protein
VGKLCTKITPRVSHLLITSAFAWLIYCVSNKSITVLFTLHGLHLFGCLLHTPPVWLIVRSCRLLNWIWEILYVCITCKRWQNVFIMGYLIIYIRKKSPPTYWRPSHGSLMIRLQCDTDETPT